MLRIYTQRPIVEKDRRITKYETLEPFGYCPADDEVHRVRVPDDA